MQFGGLSEEEIEKIKAILEQDNISYEVAEDKDIIESNVLSMQYNLRHRHPPNISTHILGININDEDFHKLSSAGKEKLLTFGITDKAPDPEEFLTYSQRPVKKKVPFQMVHKIGKALIFLMLFLMGFILLNNIFFPKPS